MLQDAQGLTVTTNSFAAIAAINCFTQQALGYGKAANDFLIQGIAADPECALLHAYRAAYLLAQESTAARKQAQPHLRFIARQLESVTLRERLYMQAIAAWSAGDLNRAIALQEAIVQDFPCDLLAVQQAQYHYFYLGAALPLLKVAEFALAANLDNHFLSGMVAFGLEQCQELEAAEVMGQQAVAKTRSDVWAQHAVAHVMETQGRGADGIVWLESLADTWDNCNSMLFTHNWWHLALFYLAQADFQKVLDLYDIYIWGRATKDSPKDQIGAIATLIRLELHGVNVGDRWQNLSPFLLARIHEHALPFQDLHYVYALAKSGQITFAIEMLLSMQTHAQTVQPQLRQSWAEIAVPAARGLVGHAIGNWTWAIAQLAPILPQLQQLGGSHTQRALFTQIYQDALQKRQHQASIYNFSARAQSSTSNVIPMRLSARLTSPTTTASHINQRQRYTQILTQSGHLSC